ncbi:putative E3 ubiquitin-protein ligase UBR7 isoform X1 [Hordeum vulgare subsp. vulgare]|uniref:putative E3 ubiquitin-protein ligase UBR7 isoform X1 n=1 Tax=Hordeum vulgare subsp. vulgare TaxID=112509 RepID=UPI001D1A3C54|nr:putative E3 ubiquitin-protein ligase UBR7 isoform X1 [Hordeum vulgare subsp. vulgare]
MAGDGIDAAFEDEVEPTVTIGEYLDGIEAEELEADLVLGGDDGNECTYGAGYLKRQAVFSCLTCVPDGVAGVCTACCLACHDGHEVVELWTKRNFRCDCGNSKFGGHLCKLSPEKDPENPANSYNQNFKGSYCTCSRPYPDPEAKEQVEMIQCCICEDWFHEDHIGLDSLEKIPKDEEGEPLYEEFICHQCSPVCYFLKLYPDMIWASSNQSVSEAVTADSNGMEGGSSGHVDTEKNENGAPVDHRSIENTSVEENCTKDIEASDKSILGDNSGGNCKIGVDINTTSADSEKIMPLFMSKGWRETLCKCGTCTNFYAQRGIAHLTDKEDSIEEYEKIAKQKREKKLEQQEGAEANFINSLDHVQKIEILSGINDMKNEFQSFMVKFSAYLTIAHLPVSCWLFLHALIPVACVPSCLCYLFIEIRPTPILIQRKGSMSA